MYAQAMNEQLTNEYHDARLIKNKLIRVYMPLFKRELFTSLGLSHDTLTNGLRIEGKYLLVWKAIADNMKFEDILGHETYDKILEMQQSVDPDGTMTIHFLTRYETERQEVKFNILNGSAVI